METTFVILKPDAVRRNLIGTILKIYEEADLTISRLEKIQAQEATVRDHYAELEDKPFFSGLVESLMASEIVILTLEGDQAVDKVRKLNGATDPAKAEADSIRGRYGLGLPDNTVHASDSPESAQREIKLWFGH